MRRKLTGTVFYGACLAAIGDPAARPGRRCSSTSCRRACRGSTGDFLTGVPSRRPDAAGILPALRRLARDRADRRRSSAFPLGVAAAIYLEEYAPTAGSTACSRRTSATSPACRRSSTASSAWRSSSACSASGRPSSPAALTLPADPAGDHHRHPSRRSGPSRTRSARGPTPSARRAGRWSARSSCRRPRRGS